MLFIGSGGVPSPYPPDGEVRSADFQAARRYLRYYQRGLAGFTVILAAVVAAELFLPVGAAYHAWFPWAMGVLAVAATLYIVAPYRRKLADFYREQIRPLLDLLSERR